MDNDSLQQWFAWQAVKPFVKPLAKSPLSLELVARHSQVIELMVAPRSENGLGIGTYVDAEIEMALAANDMCAWYYDKNTDPKDICAEFFHYVLWRHIFHRAGAEFPSVWEGQLNHWYKNGTSPAEEYLDYIQRQQSSGSKHDISKEGVSELMMTAGSTINSGALDSDVDVPNTSAELQVAGASSSAAVVNPRWPLPKKPDFLGKSGGLPSPSNPYPPSKRGQPHSEPFPIRKMSKTARRRAQLAAAEAANLEAGRDRVRGVRGVRESAPEPSVERGNCKSFGDIHFYRLPRMTTVPLLTVEFQMRIGVRRTKREIPAAWDRRRRPLIRSWASVLVQVWKVGAEISGIQTEERIEL